MFRVRLIVERIRVGMRGSLMFIDEFARPLPGPASDVSDAERTG